jgi:hypothetical protein
MFSYYQIIASDNGGHEDDRKGKVVKVDEARV